jgi:filamentous hemagglutinin
MSSKRSLRQVSPLTAPAWRKKRLAEAVAFILGGMALSAAPAWAELPVPSRVLVAPGNGRVLAPVVKGGKMTIKQLSDKAILDWESFNIGKDNAVRFSQPSSTAIALNNIHQSDPSRILGSLTANGQVYLVNQNGFLFGKNARVDTNTLVASTLSISKDVLEGGLSKAINTDGNPALTADGQVYRKDAQGKPLTDAQGKPLKREILIEQGAQLKTEEGGRILITAPSVVNKGTIKTPGGQTILAAATDKVYLQEADSQKTGVRGLLVEVATGGKVQNLGKIAARRGNVTLEGFAVNQEGMVSATTSVRLNGSVRLLAREKGSNPVAKIDANYVLLPDRTDRAEDLDDGLGKTAKVTLGQGSLTQVTPDTRDRQTAVDEQTQDPSRIEIVGKQVALLESSTVRAPSGKVSVTATAAPNDPSTEKTADPDARIDLKLGAKIDVAGLKSVRVPISRNVVEVELRSYELRDAPLQKDKKGALYGKKVRVDLRDSQDGRIPIADISGSIARIERGIKERSVKGGSVDLASAGSVNIGPDAKVDVSGGVTRYQSGYINTTWLASQGKYYEIGKADPTRHYDGILGKVTRKDETWNVTHTWNLKGPVNTGRYEKGYAEGADGGSVNIRADQLSLEGDVLGQTVDGFHQRQTGEKAAGGTLGINLGFSLLSAQPVALLGAAGDADAQLKHLAETTGGAFTNPLVLMDRYLERSGFRSASIATYGAVGVADAVDLSLPAGGKLELQAGKLEFAGRVTAPSGTVALKTQFDEGVADNKLDGQVHLAPGARIDVAGAWTNDLTGKDGNRAIQRTRSVPVDGGKAELVADGDVNLDAGAEISADAGAWLDSAGKLTEGKGGSIALAATNSGRNPDAAISSRNSANLNLGGQVHAYAPRQGGSLSLTSNQILIGDSFSAYTAPGNGLQPLVLAPGFFSAGGFNSYALTSNLNGIALGYDTHLQPRSQNLVFKADYQNAPSGTKVSSLGTLQQLDPSLCQPVNLSLALKQPANTFNTKVGITLDPGSKIDADPGAQISLQTDSKIGINGEISAPAGTIKAEVVSPKSIAFDAAQGIYLGDGAKLAAPGAVLPVATRTNGINEQKVLPGGHITLTANRGYVVLGPGSTVDVSGASAVVGESQPAPDQPGYSRVPVVRAAAAGQIALNAAEGVFVQGNLAGNSDRAHGARGGELSVSLSTILRDQPDDPNLAQTFPTAPRVIQIDQDGHADPLKDWQAGDLIKNNQNGLATLSANNLKAGGFDSLALTSENQVRFVDNVSLATGSQIVMDTPSIAMTQSAGRTVSNVALNTNFLSLGSSLIRDAATLSAASGGAGRFDASANNLELAGGLSLQGISDTRLSSVNDLRLRGVNLPRTRDFTGALLASGNLTLAASQIYPSTLTRYDIALSGGSNSTLTILGGQGKAAPVLSAGGALSMNAPNIDLGGAIRAPFGTISLNATADHLNLGNGAVVSVSAENQTIPFGQTQGGIDWVYPIGNGISLLFGANTGELAPPTGSVSLKGPKVAIASGAKVDISGGGDLWSHEFIKGSGGSLDLLDPKDPLVVSGDASYQEKYAVLPWLKDQLAPYDPVETPKSGLSVGDSVYLADAAAGLKAGKYTLLPAAYALLPGAYLVTPTASATNPMPGQPTRRVDGIPVVAARRAEVGSGFKSAQWEGFAIQRGKDFRALSDYHTKTGNSFFEEQAQRLETAAPALPRDAGRLTLQVGSQLGLNGTVLGDPAKDGKAGQLDIAADNLRVVADGGASAATGEVLLQAGQLNKLNVGSLLLGGTRGLASEDTTPLAVQSGAVVIDQGAALEGPEILLAAKDRVEVRSGAELRAVGQTGEGAGTLAFSDGNGNGDGAFLRVSTGNQVDIERAATTGNQGTLNIAPGAVLAVTGSSSAKDGDDAANNSSGSIAMDATRDASFAGAIERQDGTLASLALGANRINLGTVTDGATGLTLADSQLAGLSVDELRLRSANEIRTYGQVTLNTKTLDIQASGLAGYGNGRASLNAETLTLANPGNGTFAASADQDGSLDIKAKDFSFAGGAFNIAGFKAVNLAASGQFSAEGQGSLNIAGDTALTTPVATARAGADFSLDASGHAFSLAGGAGSASAAGLGARYTVRADRIDLGGAVLLPSGAFTAEAQQGLNLAPGASINVAGIAQTYGAQAVYTPGGDVSLASAHGDISLGSGANIDVSAPVQAGSFRLSAPEGGAVLQATLKGSATQAGGSNASLSFDLGRADDQGAAALAYGQSVGGAQDFALRLRQGDIQVGAGLAVRAHRFDLSADAGNLDIAGTLDASGTEAGAIALAAGDSVHLAASAQLLAGTDTVNARGGQVFIEAVDRDANGKSGIVADSGARIDVRGGALQNPAATPGVDQIREMVDGPTVKDANGVEYLAGDIHLRALRDSGGSNRLGVDFRATASGANEVVAEAVKVYDASQIGAEQIATWRDETQAYMAAAQAIPGLTLLPGLEIRSAGNLALDADWDFSPVNWVDFQGNPADPSFGIPVASGDWRYGAGRSLPGFLTLRAQGDVLLNSKLSDGVAPEQIAYDEQGSVANLANAIQSGASWSYRVVAGADAGAAASGQVQAGVGDLLVGDKALIRTGTGDIDLYAGRDFKLANADAAVYTVGARPGDAAQRFGSFSNFDAVWSFYAEYPTQGGDIGIQAGRDIVGAATSQFVPDWLVRTGSWVPGSPDNTQDNKTAWGIAIDQPDSSGESDIPHEGKNPDYFIDPQMLGFKQNVGALGGGNIRVTAGGSIASLSAVIPTVGQQVGRPDQKDGSKDVNQIEVHGGGQLEVKAGGDISGGTYYVGRGTGSVVSGGAITGDAANTAGPWFTLGSARLSVSARSDIAVGTVFDPFMLKERFVTGDGTFFSTYSDTSAVGFSSLAGDIAFNNKMAVFNERYLNLADDSPVLNSNLAEFKGGDYPALFYYPGQVSAQANSGSISIVHSFNMAPTPGGNLALLAGDSIGSTAAGDAFVAVNMTDTDPALLPRALNPVATDLGVFNEIMSPVGAKDLIHAPVPVHTGDADPVRIATLTGDIVGQDPLSFFLPKSARIASGGDIRDVNFEVQNLAADDITEISAQRDIRFAIKRDDNGNLANGQIARFRISGPGSLHMLAGRNIDLGSSDGLVSFGNTLNPALPLSGASVSLVAGLSDTLDTAGFLKTYLKLSDTDIGALSPQQQLEKALPVLFDIVRKAGAAAAKSGKKAYEPGFEAIKALFPGEHYQGDIDLFFSRIHTIANGDINLLTPGGMINAGLTNSALGQKTTADLGIVVQQKGAINAIAKDDFTVNESRVFTQGGGDIMIWSSDGDIDAGKGAKSALSAPPTQSTFDDQGNLVVVFPPVLSGSGIRTATSDPKKSAGDVYLFAPRGVVDAGEAGIGGNNVVIAATAVIGASNIQVSGTSVGVPSAAPPPVVPAGASSAAAAAAKSASQQVNENSAKEDVINAKEQREAATAMRAIQVDVLGFGECSVTEVRGNAEGCGG